MAYSRWLDSDWYVFWLAGTHGEEAYLEMWYVGTPGRGAGYRKLKDIDEAGLAAIVPEAPPEAIVELIEYVREFCNDVERGDLKKEDRTR